MPKSETPTSRSSMQAVPARPPLGRATAALCVLTALAGLLAYSPIPLAKMVEAEHPLLAFATSAMAATLVAAAVMAAAYRENRSRLIASALAIASGTLLLATSVSYREALKPVFPNGGFGDAMSIGITSLAHWGSGLAAITLGVFFAISFRNHRKGEGGLPDRQGPARTSPASAVVCAAVAAAFMTAPFALMACDKLARMNELDVEWNRQHADVIALFDARGLPLECSSSLVFRGFCTTTYGEWSVRYDLELECFTASRNGPGHVFVAERGTCGTGGLAEDPPGLDKRLYLVVDRLDAKALDEAGSRFPQGRPGPAGEVVDMADGRELSTDEIAALKEQAALEAIRRDRGFPQGPGVLDHGHWDDPSGREWVLCVFGKGRSFAYARDFGDDRTDPGKTLVVTESVDAVEGIRIEDGDEVVEVARLDAGTLAGLGVARCS